MQEIEFTKEDKYCIRNFGYNEVKDYEDLKQLEDEKHLIVEELEYRLQQKENIIKEARKKLINSKEYKAVKSLDFNSKMSVLIELEEILDKVDIWN